MQFKTIHFKNTRGEPVEGASVAVTLAGTATTASVFDEAGNALSLPLTTGADGNVAFAARNGTYDIAGTFGGVTKVIENEQFFDIADTNFSSRTTLVTAVAAGYTWADGTIISDGAVSYKASSGATDISDLGGLVPFDPSGEYDCFVEHFVATSPSSAVNITTALQAAIDYVEAIGSGTFGQGGKIGLKAREYTIADNDADNYGVEINNSMTIEGAGPNSTTLYINATDETMFYVGKGDATILADTAGTAVVDKVTFRGIQFYNQTSSAPTAGCFIQADRSVVECYQCRFVNHFRAVEILGSPGGCRIDNCDITAGSNASSSQAGSAGILIERRQVNSAISAAYQDSTDSLYYLEPNSVYISDCNIRLGASASQFGGVYALHIGACDGVYVQNSHLAWGTTACVGVIPSQSNMSLTDIRIEGGLIDPFPGKTNYGVYIADPTAIGSTTIGSVSLANTSISGADADGVRVTVDCNRLVMTGVDVKACADYGVFINDANCKNATFNGCNFFNTNTDAGTAAALYLDNCDRVKVIGCNFDTGYRGIQLTGNPTRVTIVGNTFDGMTTGPSIFLPASLTGEVNISGNDVDEAYSISGPNNTAADLLASLEGQWPEGSIVQGGEWFYEVAAAAATDHHVTTAGGVKLYVLPGVNGYNLGAWGIAENDISETSKFQAAIDALLELDVAEAYMPAGHYVFDQIRLYNSGGGTRAARNMFKLRGAGQLSQLNTYRGETINDFYGTILDIQPTTASDNGILLAENDTLQRSGMMEDISVIYDGTGYALDMRYMPHHRMRNVSIRITNVAGNGVDVRDSWGGLWERVYIITDVSLVGTGVGMEWRAALFAGNFELNNCQIDGFSDAFYANAGTNFANLIFKNTWFQKFQRYGFYCTSPLWNITFENCYVESAGNTDNVASEYADSYFKIAPASGSVINVRARGLYVITGTASAQWSDGAVFDLEDVENIELRQIRYYRPWQPLLHMRSEMDVEMAHISVSHDAPANLSGLVNMITQAGSFRSNITLSTKSITSHANLAWYDDTVMNVGSLEYALVPGQFALGLRHDESVSATAFNWHATDPQQIIANVTATGGGDGAIRLPGFSTVLDGDVRIVICDSTSTRGLILRDSANADLGYTLEAGQAALCIADTVNSAWTVYRQFAEQADITDLTDNSGGTGDDTIDAVSGSGADPAINNNFATLGDKVKEILDVLRAAGMLV